MNMTIILSLSKIFQNHHCLHNGTKDNLHTRYILMCLYYILQNMLMDTIQNINMLSFSSRLSEVLHHFYAEDYIHLYYYQHFSLLFVLNQYLSFYIFLFCG